MTMPSPVTGEPEEVLERFESAWQGGKPPTLEEYVASVPSGGEAAAHRWPLLRELIKIDLEYRWRRQSSALAPGALNLEGYLSRYPELRQAGPIFAELIGEEYRCRHRWGDRPAHAEYATRFRGHWSELRERLVRIDKELAAELVHEGKRAGFSPPRQALAAAAERGPLMNQVITTPNFLEALLRYQLVDPALASKAGLADFEPRGLEPRALARELLQRGWLTPYQVNQIFLGRAADLWLAPYVLLERLGEGGMGQVFKARHVDMQRLVALKLLRKDMLVDAEAVSRFGREVRLLSKLTDPHVVQALDACLSGTPPYLVMEYVEGMSLGQLVKARGPLPVTQACDYIRQAALGLQHVHEQGMVHRDLKPANLIVSGAPAAGVGAGSTSWGTLKVMDLGLGRLLARPGAVDAPTASGAVMMGTLDYMAPEQALDFRQADIRSDIYSLGCTLYFLLTGRPPFAEGTPAQKLLMHQMKDPAPLAQFCRDLPPALPALVSRMMAKQPRDRMQMPIEVARLLEPFCPTGPTSAGALVPVAPRRGALVPVVARQPAAPVAVIVIEASPKARIIDRLRAWLSQRPPLQRRRIILGAGVCAALFLSVLAWFLAGAIWGKAEEVFLVDLPETSLPHGARLGKGNLGFGRPIITVRGRASPKGLFLPPPERGSAQVRYQLTKRFRQFKAIVTLDDSFPECPTPITFAVIGDGKVLWQSTPVRKQGDEQEVTVKVTGIDVLELTVSCPGDPGGEDSGKSTRSIWINPCLFK